MVVVVGGGGVISEMGKGRKNCSLCTSKRGFGCELWPRC